VLAEEKLASVQGMEVALDELQALREAQPVDPVTQAAILAAMHQQLEATQKAKRARFQEVLRDAKRVEVMNDTAMVQVVTINGTQVVLQPGANTVPEPFAEAWREHLEMVREALQRDLAIRGSLDFGALEDWVAAGREGPPELDSARVWSEE